MPQFNVLSLDPINPDTFPAGLWDAVASTAAATAAATTVPAWRGRGERSTEERLREQMRADALQPLDPNDDDADAGASCSPKNADFNSESHLPPKMIEEAAQFLRLNVSARPVRASAGLIPFAPWGNSFQLLITLLVTDRGTPGTRFAVFAYGIPLLFLVWHAV